MEKFGEMLQTKEKKKILHFRVLFFSFLSLLLGIIFCRKIASGNVEYILIPIVLFAIVIYFCFRSKNFLPFLICFLMLAVGMGLFVVSMSKFNSQTIYEGTHVIVGRVATDEENSTSLTLENVTIDGSPSANVKLYIDSNNGNIKCGYVVCFSSEVTKINLFKLGNYDTKYVRSGICYETTTTLSNILIVEDTGKYLDETIRAKIKESLFGAMDESSASIAYAIVTGDKAGISEENYENFKLSGIVHLLCVSGLHVGILATALAFVLKLLKANKFLNLAINIVVLGFYCYICGFTPAVLRASLMSIIFLFSNLCGREADGLSSVGLAGIILCLISPLSAFDAGFLMSFFCVIFIILFYKPVFKVANKIFPKWASSYLALSICSQIGVLPFLASFYSRFNLILFFVNIFIVPFFTVLFIALFVAMLLTMIWNKFGFLLFLPQLGLTFMTSVASNFNEGLLSFEMKPFPVIVSVLIYLSVFSLSYFFMASKRVKGGVFAFLFTLIALFGAVSYIEPKNSRAEIYFYQSGYSSVIFMRSVNGETLSYNFSSGDDKFLDYINVHHIDYMLKKESPSYATILGNEKYNVKKYFVINSSSGREDVVSLANVPYDIQGRYKVSLINFEGKNFGFMVEFDGLSIFLAFEFKIEYNMKEKLIEVSKGCDIMLLSNALINAELPFKCGKIASKYSSYVDYSYEEFGNFVITEKFSAINVRGID